MDAASSMADMADMAEMTEIPASGSRTENGNGWKTAS
jgi:hypothetical protein